MRRQVSVHGVVQGIGFRPTAYRLAFDYSLAGFVRNETGSVHLEIEGPLKAVEAYLSCLRSTLVSQGANITAWTEKNVPCQQTTTFTIASSLSTQASLYGVQKDQAPCPQCIEELTTIGHRRFEYPFISCTTCGPRYSIMTSQPFDRNHTTFTEFPMCLECQREYENPLDRRFHAQTISCPQCGPQLTIFEFRKNFVSTSSGIPASVVKSLENGGLWGIKTGSGFQLVADATRSDTISRIRTLKHRPRKPLVVMVSDLDTAQTLVSGSSILNQQLTSAVRPIVLMPKRRDAPNWVERLSSGCHLGVMLPTHPIYFLLLSALKHPLVVTSFNAGDEPLIIDEFEALQTFSGAIDGLLSHNLKLIRGLDDSIIQEVCDKPQVLRLGRGLSPWVQTQTPSIRIPTSTLGLGSTLKNAVALVTPDGSVLSQHIGDLRSVATFRKREAIANDFIHLFQVTPSRQALDRHPQETALQTPPNCDVPMVRVQHHEAHLAAVALEHNQTPPYLGVVWDGFGYGKKDNLSSDTLAWGGEFFLRRSPEEQSKRIASIVPFPLIGGDQATKHPKRCMLGALWAMDPSIKENLDPWILASRYKVSMDEDTEWKSWLMMLSQNLNCPLTSSIGRLFDATAALLGFTERSQYEGEAAGWLMDLAQHPQGTQLKISGAWHQTDAGAFWDWRPLWKNLITALNEGHRPEDLSLAFHRALGEALVQWGKMHNIRTILLTGGVFQNHLLTEIADTRLSDEGFKVLINRTIPPGDGGLALGQAICANSPPFAPLLD